jgi:polyisoprenoid-binding protein YceI
MFARTVRSALPLAAVLLGAAAGAGETTRFSIEDDQVFVGYQVSVGKSQLSGVSHGLSGSVTVAGEGAQVKLRVPVASFESGLSVADAALRGALESAQFPNIEFEGHAALSSNDDATLQFQGKLRMHGVEKQITVPVKVIRDGRLAFVNFALGVSLDSFGVLRPAVGGVAIGDKVEVQVVTRLHSLQTGAAVASF